MSSEQKLEEIYEDLSRLLYDVCYFLNGEVDNGVLSPEATMEAKKLVQRSQEHCIVLTNISNQMDKSYMHMVIKNNINEEDNAGSEYVETDNKNQSLDEEEVNYEVPVTLSPTSSSPISGIGMDCPYNNSTVQDLLPRAIKDSVLYRKERIFIIEQKKLLYGVLIEHWLIIYAGNKTNVKPIQTIDVSSYEAHVKKEFIFEITSSGKKSFEFIAKSYKEMEQWIAAINYRKTYSKLDTISYDSSIEKIKNPETESIVSEIYENIDEVKAKSKRISIVSTNSEDLPCLPPRKSPSMFNKILEPKKDQNVQYTKYNNIQSLQKSEEPEEEEFYDDLVDYQRKDQVDSKEDNLEEEVEYHEPEEIILNRPQITSKLPSQIEEEEEEEIEYHEPMEIIRPIEPKNNTILRSFMNKIGSKTSKKNKTPIVIKQEEEEEEEEEAIYDELSVPIEAPKNNNITEKCQSNLHPQMEYKSKEKSKLSNKLPVAINQKDDEEKEYDELAGAIEIPKDNNKNSKYKKINTKSQVTKNQEEEEEVEYDELSDFELNQKIPNNSTIKIPDNKHQIEIKTSNYEEEEEVEYDDLADYQQEHINKTQNKQTVISNKIESLQTTDEDIEYDELRDFPPEAKNAHVIFNDDTDMIYDDLAQPSTENDIQNTPENSNTKNTSKYGTNSKVNVNNNNEFKKKIAAHEVKNKPQVTPKPIIKPNKPVEIINNNTTKKDEGSKTESSKRVHNIIQHMERTLSFKVKK